MEGPEAVDRQAPGRPPLLPPPHAKRCDSKGIRAFRGEPQAYLMLARYYSSSLARFMAVDPRPDSAKLDNPQSWNRYTYALNNPLRFIDPDGRKYVDKEGQKQAENCKKNCNEKQKKDVEKAEASEKEIHTEESAKAGFGKIDPKTGERTETKEIDTGNKKGKDEADKMAADIEAGKSEWSMLAGTNDPNPDGSVTIKIYMGSQQYSKQDRGKSKDQYRATTFAHESHEAIGGTHREAEEHETP